MPRARTTTADDLDVVSQKPRAPRTRRVIDVDSKGTQPVSRRKPPTDPVAPEVVRKAPTPLRATQGTRIRRERSLLVVLGVCLTLFGIGFGIGLSDQGVIDVVAVVTERNEKINRGEVRDASGNTVTKTVGVQNQAAEPNGGLILADPNLVTPPPAPVVSSSTATSTATQGTTTPAITEMSASTTNASST